LLHSLAERLRACGRDPLVTREPGGTTAGERLRALLLDVPNRLDPMTELFIVCAARAQHVAEAILPALQAGRTVLCDRFVDATRAYQGGGRGIDDATILACSAFASRGVWPRLTFLLDVEPQLSQERIAARSGASGTPRDRMEREDIAFHRRVRACYLDIARAEPERVVVLDGACSQEHVVAAAWPHVAAAAGIA
jgi:dTMP kinase